MKSNQQMLHILYIAKSSSLFMESNFCLASQVQYLTFASYVWKLSRDFASLSTQSTKQGKKHHKKQSEYNKEEQFGGF